MDFIIPNNWLPTSASINALPEPLRKYIHGLETYLQSELVQENFELHENIKGIRELALKYKKQIKEGTMDPETERQKEEREKKVAMIAELEKIKVEFTRLLNRLARLLEM